MSRSKISDILDLSIPERIKLVQEIWDSIAAVPQEILLTDEQKIKLDSRAATLRADPSSGALWEEIKANLRL